MRILQLIDSLEVGGAERMAVNYATALHGKIAFSALCVTRAEGDLKQLIHEGVSYLFLNKKRTLDFKAMLRLRRFVQRNKIEIIQAHGSSYFVACLVKMSTPNLKLIWHDHYGNSEFLDQRNTRFLKPLSRFFDGVISVNDTLRLWAKDVLHIKKAFYIKNFIADPLPLDSNFIPEGIKGKRIVCVANLRPQKNHLLLLKSFKKVLETDTEFTLHLFGNSEDTLCANAIFKAIKDLQLTGSVFYYGTHLGISSILPYFDIGVLASDSEGLPLALLEYGQAGLAVITTDVGQCAAVIDGAGICVPANNEPELTAAILVYGSHSIQAKKQALSFQNKIEKHYTSSAILPQVMAIYDQIT